MRSEVLAIVRFPRNGASTLHLTTEGWVLLDDGPGVAPFESLLNRVADTSRYGPADGDPVALAAADAARLLDGTVGYVRPVGPVPSDAVY